MLILNFHRVEPPTGLEITRLAPARFRAILDALDTSGLPVAGRSADPLAARNRILLTFDDGFESISRNALPEILGRGWGALVFLIAGFVGKNDDWDVRLLGRKRPMMTWSKVKSWAAEGIEFGSHTLSHADLTALTPRALSAELADSKSQLEQQLARPVRFLAYPYGRHNARVRDAVAEAGYAAAYSTGGRLWDGQNPLAIPRVGISGMTSLFEIRSMIRKEVAQGRGEGMDWRRRWHGRIFESLNAGSAAVGNWRRAHSRQSHAAITACATNN
ncbi:MAG: polysaccharide deacetylase family protein [candidate division Zixibacteria bacterium]|nr:polysaccharide deacetylase family protein [candidate division Zixibacteria bacterium]